MTNKRNDHSLSELWARIVIDKEMKILEVTHFDDRLFFGKYPQAGKTIKEVAGKENLQQFEVIDEGILRARNAKRNACFVYLSTYSPTDSIHTCAHVEYHDDGSVCLYLIPIDKDDLHLIQKNAGHEFNAVMQVVYESLPIGIEIYDCQGRLIEINSHSLRTIGVQDKKSVLGVCFFDNPFLSNDTKVRLLAGENVSGIFDCDFGHLGSFFKTTKKGISQIEYSISVIRNKGGEIDKYIIISQDVSKHVQLKRQYKSLYTQNETILNSLPVGIGVYASDGTLIYFNDVNCRILGVDSKTIMEHPINIHDSPGLPQKVKDAVRSGLPVHENFPYNFREITDKGYYTSSHTRVRQIECNGSPIFNSANELDQYVFIVEDITEKIQREELFRQNRQKTEVAMRAADIMLWEFDVLAKLFFSDNEPMNGYDRSKPLTVEHYLETVHPDDRDVANQVMERMLRGEVFSFNFNIRVIFPVNPEWQYCSVDVSPYQYNAEGRVVRYVGTRKNITELHKRKLLQEKILNDIPMSIHIKDVENDFRYVFCNDESKSLFGTSEDKTTYDIMNTEGVERIRKTDLEVFSTGEPYLGLERVLLKDGRDYEMIVRKSIINDNGKRLLLSVRWDQSLQNELQRRSRLLSLSLEAMTAFTWYFEPEKNRINYGDGFDKIGRKASELDSPEKFMNYLHPDDIQPFLESLQAVLSGEVEIWENEYRADLRGNGEYIWWEGRGMLETSMLNDVPYQYMFGMTICIEPHKQTEAALLKSKEELSHLIRQNELILNNTNSGLAYITMDYVVQWENISICFGNSSLKAYERGKYCYQSVHNRTAPCENCVLQRSFVSHQVESIQFAFGDNRMVEVFATPVFNEDGSMDGIVVRVDDITEREGMIKELKQAKAKAEQSDKLKSAFLANMSHEIRTPLNAIVGFSDLLRNSVEEEEKEEYINIINTNNELLLKLINDILDLSKIEAGSIEFVYEKFDLAEYFNVMTMSMRQRVTKPNIRLLAVNPYSHCIVKLDKNRVAQLMTNYVNNAIKYTPKGFIEMGYECLDGGIRFYVKDSGIGISDEKKDRVFSRFAKLDEFAQGTGLGLSICKAIAEAMGGKVGFESTFGEGSMFWVFLPCLPEVKLFAEISGQQV